MDADYPQKWVIFACRLTYSARDGINIARYALKMAKASGTPPMELLALAVERVLGDEALRYLKG